MFNKSQVSFCNHSFIFYLFIFTHVLISPQHKFNNTQSLYIKRGSTNLVIGTKHLNYSRIHWECGDAIT